MFQSSLTSSNWIRAINAFLRSPAYILLIAGLCALSAVFGLELPVYTVYIAFCVYICLFCSDLLPLMPIVVCCYLAPSFANNPGRNPQSIFYPQHGGLYLIILAVIFAVCLICRLVWDPVFGGKRFLTRKRSLTVGMLVLGVAYLLGGIGSAKYAQYAGGTLLFAFLQFVSVFAMYFLFSGAVDWENTPRDYFAWVGMSAAFAVLAQLGENYLSGRIFMEGTNTMDRELMATGWGMHNNIGGFMATMIPLAFFLAIKRRPSWLYTLLAVALMLGTILSCSRTSMLIAALEFAVCSVILLRDKETRKANLFVYGGAALCVIVFAVAAFDKLMVVFALFFEEIGEVSKRDLLFINGMKQFLENPVFGGTFYPQGEFVPWDWSELEAFSSFFPPRWHNTLVQIAASCGAVGLAAYGLHRFQTVKLFLKERSTEKLFIGLYVGALLVASLLDCHFFNIGPVLVYSMALAFAENIGDSKL